MDEYCFIITTFRINRHEKTMEKMIKTLIQEKLIACAKIIGSDSYGTWIHMPIHNDEYMVFMTSKKALFTQAENKIKEMHPYDIPEITMIDIPMMSKDYAAWLEGVLK